MNKKMLTGLLQSSRNKSAPDYMFYIRIFEGCNAYCSHCFIPSNPKKMSMDNVFKIPDQVIAVAPKGSRVMFQWHGGEPTVMGHNFIKESIIFLNNKLSDDYKIEHGIQTNLLNYTREWDEVFSSLITQGQFGVSWDVGIRHIRSKGVNKESNKAFDKIFFNNLSIVSRVHSPVITMTTTRYFFESFPEIEAIVSRFLRYGIREVHLERLTKTGYAKDNWLDVGVTNHEYSIYMSNLLKGYIEFKKTRPDVQFNISPFDGLIASVSSLQDDEKFSYGCWSGGCDSGFHTIDANGYKSGCTALTSENDNKNVLKNNGTISFMDKDSVMSELNRRRTCGDCEFSSICSTGCAALDFDDGSNECSGAKGLFLAIKDVVLNNN